MSSKPTIFHMKIHDLINHKFSGIIDFFGKNYTFQDYYFTAKVRPGLINENKLNHSFGSNFYDILPSASSGEESETDLENEPHINLPTIYEVAESMTDISTIKFVENLSSIPRNIYPALAFYLEIPHISASELKELIQEINFFKKKRYIPEIEEIRIIQDSYRSCIGYVVPSFISDTSEIYNHFLNFNKQIKVKYCYDILNTKNSKWYGVILRNLPENFELKTKMDEHELIYESSLMPQRIRDSYCTIIKTSTLEESENICFKFKKSFDKIKANLHPKCCKQHNNVENSIFKNFYLNVNFSVKGEGKRGPGNSRTNIQSQSRSRLNSQNFIDKIIRNEDSNNSSFLSKKRLMTETISLI